MRNWNEPSDFICGYQLCNKSKASWRQRITDRYGLVLCVGGAGQVFFEGEHAVTTRGEVILLKPHFTHEFFSLDNWHLLWFHFQVRSHIAHALRWTEHLPGMAKVSVSEEEFETIHTTLQEAHRLDLSRPRNWNDLALLLVESVVVRGYNRSLANASKVSGVIHLSQKLLTETENSIDSIARHCGISRAGLYAKFRAEVGISPRRYRENARLRRGAQLLELPELSVSEIAQQVKFPDPFYFSTRFHNFFGVSPSEFRKRLLKNS